MIFSFLESFYGFGSENGLLPSRLDEIFADVTHAKVKERLYDVTTITLWVRRIGFLLNEPSN
jgi:hypothetical protein